MKIRSLSAILLMLPLSAASPAAGQPKPHPTFVIEAKVIALRSEPGEDLQLLSGHSEETPGEISPSLDTATAGTAKIRMGQHWFTVDRRGTLLRNGTPVQPETPGIEMLSEPRLEAAPGQEVVLRSGSRMNYFEPVEGGNYALRVTDPDSSPGLELRCTARPAKGGRIQVDYDLRLVVLADREKIPGVNLDVGKPSLRTQQISDRLLLEQGQWSAIASRLTEATGEEVRYVLLLLLRASQKGS